MDYYFLDVNGNTSNMQAIRIKWSHENLDWEEVDLRKGIFTADTNKPVKLVQDDVGGNLLTSVLSNTESLLFADENIRQIMSKIQPNNIDYIPVEIKLREGTLLDKNYYLIAPNEKPEVLDYEKSVIQYFKDRKEPKWITSIDKIVFDKQKLEQAPHVFRFLKSRVKLSSAKKCWMPL
jgi:hypothetical protein